jgi:cytochrome c oxidase subunit 1
LARGVTDIAFDDAEIESRLADTWKTPSGLWAALSTVDHKIIGRRYIVTAFAFLILGGVLALAMRIQLARPEARLSVLIVTIRYSPCTART